MTITQSPILRRLRWALTVASDIVPKLPGRGDGKLTMAVKALAILDSLNKRATKDNGLYHFFEKLDVDTQSNAQFVELFFATPLHTTFRMQKVNLTDYVDIVVADDAAIGTLYFAEYHWGAAPEPSKDFWFSPGFKFAAALERLWGMFENGIHASIKIDASGQRSRTVYESIPVVASKSIGKNAIAKLSATVARHHVYRKRGFARTYLLEGKQGVGKTTFALLFAKSCGKRTLRLDARGMTTAAAQDLGLILSGLRPDFLIVDDIDKVVELASALPSLLNSLTALKDQHANVTAVLTANNTSVLDPAFVRPGRIDEVIEFAVPDAEERLDIVCGYLEEFDAPTSVLNGIVDFTEGLTAAYLRELALQTSLFPGVDLKPTIKRMKELAEKATAPAVGPAPATAPTAKAVGWRMTKTTIAFVLLSVLAAASLSFMAWRCVEGVEMDCAPWSLKVWLKDAFGYPKAMCLP